MPIRAKTAFRVLKNLQKIPILLEKISLRCTTINLFFIISSYISFRFDKFTNFRASKVFLKYSWEWSFYSLGTKVCKSYFKSRKYEKYFWCRIQFCRTGQFKEKNSKTWYVSYRFINKGSEVHFLKDNKFKCNFKNCMPLFCIASSLLLSKVQKGFTGI